MEKLEVYYRTDKGRKTNNEDSVLARQIGETYLLAVADGLGGQASGEVASKMALIELDEFFKAHLQSEPTKEIMTQAIGKANREIYLLSQENREYKGMGSTLVVALIYRDKALIANIGDSRAYWITDEINQITRDHSLVQEMVDKNTISSEEAQHHPQKNIVTRVLGTKSELQADFFELSLNGGTLLLCSDGLPDSLRDDEIKNIVCGATELETACTSLVDEAKKRGEKDNISLILARLLAVEGE
jgi:serine/threonine protein phosphatase PrpC